MTTMHPPLLHPRPAAWRLAVIAAALAGAAGAGQAATANLKITSFTVSTTLFSETYAWSLDPYQSYNLTALQAGGLGGQQVDNYASNDWNLGLNRTASTASTATTGTTVQFTDASTQLTTAGFVLASSAAPSVGTGTLLPNYANASAVQQGSFVIYDANGTLSAGTLTFDVYYDMSVSATPGNAVSRYGQTEIDLLSSSDAGGTASFTDGLLSSALAGGTGDVVSGHFTWSYALAAGEAASYTLSGSAITSEAVTAIPEPGTWALTGLGLAAVGVWSRRRTAGAR